MLTCAASVFTCLLCDIGDAQQWEKLMFKTQHWTLKLRILYFLIEDVKKKTKQKKTLHQMTDEQNI